jgi:hypothetical protein
MARTTIQEFPFVSGQNEAIDAKVLPDGLLTRAKNVRLRKDARWGVRADFTSIGPSGSGPTGTRPVFDLAPYGEELCALLGGSLVTSDTALYDIAEYAGTGSNDWRPSATVVSSGSHLRRLGNVTNLRALSAFSPLSIVTASSSITRIDCAAAAGIICFVYETNAARARFIRASTGATIYETFNLGSGGAGIKPRVVAIGSTFFFTVYDAGAGEINLYSMDPSSATNETDLGAIFTGTVACYDLAANRAGTGGWIAVNTTTPTTILRPFNTSGVAGTDITGPAVAYDDVAIRETATRVHLASVIPASGACQLRSYTTAGALSTGPTTVIAACARQPGLTEATVAGIVEEEVAVFAEDVTSPNRVRWKRYSAVGHSVRTDVTYSDTFLGARPISAPNSLFHHLFGGIIPDGSFFSAILSTADALSTGGTGDDCSVMLDALVNKFAASKPSADHTPNLARDSSTGKVYWPTLTVSDTGVSRPLLYEVDFLSSARRQTAQVAGLLYVGGGTVEVYDGKSVVPSGFFERPRILSATPSNGAGSLPSSVTLLVALVWETRDALGNVIQSDISEVSSVVMGVADDTITVAFPTPHGTRASGGDIVAVCYRSISGVSQLRRAESSATSPITLLAGDTTVRANGVIYTQAGRGALSGTTPHEAPLPADYLWKFGARLIAANADQAMVSKEIFPTEQVTWSGSEGFTIPKISERITGVAALDQRGLLFTADRIYQFSGEGPNDLGEGRFSEPLPAPSSTGLSDWRSLVETPLGLFFQGSNGQLWMLPRDSSAPVWIGQPVRDTLVAFPVVTSATLVTEEQLVSFTCNNSGGTDGRIVSYDLRANTWIVDEFASSMPLSAACSYQQRLAILSAGVVYTEKTTVTPTTFIEHGLTTGDIKPFGGTGWGKICSVDLIGEYRGDCDLYLRVSYDSGKSFTTLTKIHQLRSASYAAGDIVRVSWDPLRRKAERIRLEFTAKTPGSATEGFVFNGYALELLGDVRGASRKAAAQRG